MFDWISRLQRKWVDQLELNARLAAVPTHVSICKVVYNETSVSDTNFIVEKTAYGKRLFTVVEGVSAIKEKGD